MLLLAVAPWGCSEEPKGVTLSASDLGDRWLLTVTEGTLRCEHGTAVVFEAGGSTYALNGTAMGVAERYGYEDVAAIWAPNTELGMGGPDSVGTEEGPGRVIDRGLDVCE